MAIPQKIQSIAIQVPYKEAGGVIHQHNVIFDVFEVDDHYSLKPRLSEEERRIANLPETLDFFIENGKPVSLRGKQDSNLHIMQDAVALLHLR